MKVLIVGGGIGGLALGAFLRDSNIEYEIVEKAADFEHQGFLISMWDNGRDILKKLQLDEEFDAAGSRIHRYSICDGAGRVLRDYSLAHLYSEFGGAVTIIGRKELHAMVLKKLGTEKVRMGCAITSLEQKKDSVSVSFSDGTKGEYDAVIGADGVHSKVRGCVFKDAVESYTNWRAWYVWIDNTYTIPATAVEYIEAREFIVTFTAGGRTLATFIAPAEHTVWDTPEGRVERLKKLFKDETHIVPSALEKLKDEEVLPTDLIDVRMRQIVNGRVVLLGDAAHSFGPLAGLGTSMALEDAYVLAGELLKITQTSEIENAFKTYQAHRKERTEIARRVTFKLRNMELTKSSFIMRIIKAFAPFTPERVLVSDFRRLLQEEI